MWKTAARQCSVGVAASLIVQEACDVYTFCSATRDENSRKKTKKFFIIKMSPHVYLFVRKTCRNLVSAGLRITCAATGAAAGSKVSAAIVECGTHELLTLFVAVVDISGLWNNGWGRLG